VFNLVSDTYCDFQLNQKKAWKTFGRVTLI